MGHSHGAIYQVLNALVTVCKMTLLAATFSCLPSLVDVMDDECAHEIYRCHQRRDRTEGKNKVRDEKM